MYAKYSNVVNARIGQSPATANEFKLKQHHHVRLDREFKLDCHVWLESLEGKLRTVVNRPMVDLLEPAQTSDEISFYSDASKKIGFGAVLNDRWLRGDWNPEFIKTEDPSIAYLELYALCAGVLAWENHTELINTRITIFCDNIALVEMINDMVSSCKNCMYLLRLLTLNCLKFNRRLKAKYINTKSNCLADSLSRNQMHRFRSLAPNMQLYPDPLPELIWPVNKIWERKS